MTLSICLATRGRPDRLGPTIERTLANISLPGTRLVVAVDEDDRATRDARLPAFKDPRVTVSVLPREDSMGEKYDRVLALAPADVYLPMVDYAPHVTPGFDARILDAASLFPDGIGVVYNHMANLSFPQIIAITAKLADKMGFFVPPGHPYWFWDQDMDIIAHSIGRIAVADVWLDCGHKPETQERRDFAFWAAYSNARMLWRQKIAREIILAPDFQEPEWRKKLLLAHHTLFEEQAFIRNAQVKAALAASPQPAADERSDRIKARAAVALQGFARDIDREAARISYDHPFAQQHPVEIKWLCEHARGVTSILEVGSCYGHSLRLLAEAAAHGAKIRAIDFGDGTNWNTGHATAPKLKAVADDLRARGFNVGLWFGDSHNPRAVDWAAAAGPYDLVFIDGDHSHEGAKADFENYGPLGKLVAFHDIAHAGHGVQQLWAEIEAAGFVTEKIIVSGMGIGLVRYAQSKRMAA